MKVNSDIFLNIKNENFIFDVCGLFLEYYGGNIVEIGAGEGFSTVNFLKLCDNVKKNSKVIVIDPFESGWDSMPITYGTPYPYHKFNKNTESLKKHLILIKKSSQDKSVLQELFNLKPITFGFIDGLQYKEAVISDLELLDNLNCKLICVDDSTRINEFSEVPLAVEHFIKNNKYIMYNDEKTVRGKCYLIKKTI